MYFNTLSSYFIKNCNAIPETGSLITLNEYIDI